MSPSPERRRQFFKSFEAKSLKSRSFLTQIADDLTEICGSTPFLVFHIILFTAWIVLNTHVIPGAIPFDPYPLMQVIRDGVLYPTCNKLPTNFTKPFCKVSYNT